MNKFLIYLIKRILVLGIILFILDFSYTYIYINKKGVRTKIEYIFQNKNKQFDYIFFGSSRVEFHINTPLINNETGKKSLNLGTSGQNLPETFLALKLLVSQNIEAKKYFIQIDETDLVKTNKKKFSGESYFLPYIKNKEIKKHLKKYDLDYINDTKIPFYRYMNYGYKIGYRELLLKLGNKNRTKDFYIGLDITLKNDTVTNRFRKKYDTKLINEIALYGKENNLKLIFYTSPYYNVENESNFKKILKENNIYIYIDSITDAKFYKDKGHLNKYGADIFTKMIIRDFKLKSN